MPAIDGKVGALHSCVSSKVCDELPLQSEASIGSFTRDTGGRRQYAHADHTALSPV